MRTVEHKEPFFAASRCFSAKSSFRQTAQTHLRHRLGFCAGRACLTTRSTSSGLALFALTCASTLPPAHFPHPLCSPSPSAQVGDFAARGWVHFRSGHQRAVQSHEQAADDCARPPACARGVRVGARPLGGDGVLRAQLLLPLREPRGNRRDRRGDAPQLPPGALPPPGLPRAHAPSALLAPPVPHLDCRRVHSAFPLEQQHTPRPSLPPVSFRVQFEQFNKSVQSDQKTKLRKVPDYFVRPRRYLPPPFSTLLW